MSEARDDDIGNSAGSGERHKEHLAPVFEARHYSQTKLINCSVASTDCSYSGCTVNMSGREREREGARRSSRTEDIACQGRLIIWVTDATRQTLVREIIDKQNCCRHRRTSDRGTDGRRMSNENCFEMMSRGSFGGAMCCSSAARCSVSRKFISDQ